MDDLPVDAQSRELFKLWRVWKTIHEMLADRGYELAEDEIKISLDRFKADYTNGGAPDRTKMQFSARPSDSMLVKHTPAPTPSNPSPLPNCGPVWVEFLPQDKLGIKEIQAFCAHVSTNQYKCGIMIAHNPLSPAARKALAAAEQVRSGPSCECFLEEDLIVNITHHELVPRHVLLSAQEKAALLKRYRLKDTQLPRILRTDPVSRYLGLSRGQVVKIVRASETAGRYASYRLCV